MLVASGAAFLTFVSWSATTIPTPGDGQFDDARLAMVTFAVLMVVCLIVALVLMMSVGGGR